MKINFKKIETQVSYKGEKKTFDVTETVADEMKYSGNILLDIGFERLADAIYDSQREVEIPERYSKAIELVVRNSRLVAAVKREIINQLNKKEES